MNRVEKTIYRHKPRQLSQHGTTTNDCEFVTISSQQFDREQFCRIQIGWIGNPHDWGSPTWGLFTSGLRLSPRIYIYIYISSKYTCTILLSIKLVLFFCYDHLSCSHCHCIEFKELQVKIWYKSNSNLFINFNKFRFYIFY